MSKIQELYIPIEKVDFNILKELQSKELITVKETNENEPEKLYICNYTETCAFSRAWDRYTIQCRGLIINKEGEVIARPFPKFFNFEEPEAIIPSDEDFVVSYKEDGSCGILYWIGGVAKISTRGSFNSDQAIKATEILNRKYSHIVPKLDKEYTYIFEIIYPENRIVLDYGGMEDLILLGKIHIETGNDVSLNMEDDLFPIRKTFKNANQDLSALKEITEKNIEGFVVHFMKSNIRVKVKMEEYKRLHKIITGLSEKGVWEMLKDNQDMSIYLQNVPDEFFKWFIEVKSNLEKEFKEIELLANKVYNEVISDEFNMRMNKSLDIEESKLDKSISISEKEIIRKKSKRRFQAAYITKSANDISGIVFNMLDGGNYAYGIWARIKPNSIISFQKEKSCKNNI